METDEFYFKRLVMIKKIKNIIAYYKIITTNPGILKVVADIFKFIETTYKEERPMICKIVVADIGDENKYTDFVSLWAGIGESNPIDRCSQLKYRQNSYHEYLKIASERELTDLEKNEVKLMLKVFEI